MTKNERVLKRALEMAAEWILDRARTYSYSCPHCPCSKDNDKYRTCFGTCEKEIVKEFKNRVFAEKLSLKAKSGNGKSKENI